MKEMETAITNSISDGESVPTVDSSFVALPHSVKFKLELENATKWNLEPMGAFPYWGNVANPQPAIFPGKREAMSGHKTRGCATGVSGIAVWHIRGTDEYLVIAFKVPKRISHNGTNHVKVNCS